VLLRAARAKPERLFVAIDPAWQAMSEASRAALRPPAKGGAPNAMFVTGALESLPSDLAGAADEVRVILPWGSLLRAVWQPEVDGLRAMRQLCQPSARLEVVVAIVAGRDGDLCAEPSASLVGTYQDAGFEVHNISKMTGSELRSLGTTWAKKLAGRPGQRAWRIRAAAV
jgi:16S rRNA (adenine(1408)-N(1))-methyltransferase